MLKLSLATIVLVSVISQAPAAETVVVAYTKEWHFLHPMGISPAIADGNFDTTWYLTQSEFVSDYDGPDFAAASSGSSSTPSSINSGVGPGPLGYNQVDNWNGSNTALLIPLGEEVPITEFGTTLTQPGPNNRKASYYRTVFTTETAMARPVIRGMFDDGAVIFLDGVQVARVNVTLSDPSSVPVYSTVAVTDGTLNGSVPSVHESTENTLHTINLTTAGNKGTPGGLVVNVINPVTSLPAGEHTLAVFLCNWSHTNPDQLMALEMTADNGGINAVASNVSRNVQGTPANPSDDTFEFDVTVSYLGGGGVMWQSSAPQRPTGSYGTAVRFAGFPVSGNAVINFNDQTSPALTATLSVPPPPAPLWMGDNRLVSPAGALTSAPGNGALWQQDGSRTIRQTNGSGVIQEVRSTVVSIPPQGAAFQMTLEVSDSSAGSNFETSDTFEAYLELTSASNTETVNLLPAALDTSGDGVLNGYSGSDYNTFLVRDELNFASRFLSESFTESLAMNFTIPAGYQSAQLVIRAANNEAAESFRVKNVTFAPAGTVFDADMDTVADADEFIGGTNAFSAASKFSVQRTLSPTQMAVSFQTVASRSYRIMASSDMQNWTQLNTSSIIGDGSVQNFSFSASPARRFILVQTRRGAFPFSSP